GREWAPRAEAAGEAELDAERVVRGGLRVALVLADEGDAGIGVEPADELDLGARSEELVLVARRRGAGVRIAAAEHRDGEARHHLDLQLELDGVARALLGVVVVAPHVDVGPLTADACRDAPGRRGGGDRADEQEAGD